MTNDKILDKIRKMLALANNAGAFDNERANALSQAHKWIAKYNIDMATLEAGLDESGGLKATVNENRIRVESVFFGAIWTRAMCHTIADLFFCNYVYRRISNNTDDITHTFVGRESNATTAEIVAKYVVQSIYKEGMAYKRTNGGHYSDFRAFAHGAASRIIERAIRMKRDADETMQEEHGSGAGTALVLADYYKTEKEKNAQMLGKVRTVQPRMGKLRNREALLDGHDFGDKVSLTPQLGQAKQSRLTSKV